MADFDPLGFDPVIGATRARAAQPWRRRATPEQADNFATQAAHAGLSGLGYVLSVMDKPGRAVRGVLAGKPHEALAALPFSDTLGITNPEDSVSGAQLNAKRLGVKDDNSWKSWGLGLATEIATDPLSYATFGTKHALTTAGKAANKQGLLRGMSAAQKVKGFDYAEDALRATPNLLPPQLQQLPIDEAIDHLRRSGSTVVPAGSGIAAGQPLAGLARVGVPGGPAATLGTGKLGQAVAPALDSIGQAIKYRVPGAKSLSALFDSSVARAVHEPTQRGMRAAGAPAAEAAGRVGRAQQYAGNAVLQDLIAKGQANGQWDEHAVQQAARMAMEGVSPSSVLPVHADLWQGIQALSPLKGEMAARFPERRTLGIPGNPLADPFVEHATRQGLANTPKGPQMRGGTLFRTTSGGNMARKYPLRGIPGGTSMLQRWSTDPQLAGAGRLATPDVEDRLFKDMLAQASQDGKVLPDIQRQVRDPATKQMVTVTLDHAAQLKEKAAEVAERLAAHDPSAPIFSADLVKDIELGAARHGKATAAAKAFYGTVGESAQPLAPGMVPVSKLLAGIRNSDRRIRLKTWYDPAGISGAHVELHKALAKQGAEPTEEFVRGLMGPIQSAATPKDQAKALRAAKKQLQGSIDRYGFSPEKAAQILRDYSAWRAPDETVAPIKLLDSFTNFFRNSAYSIWLPSHVRNLAGGMVQAATRPDAPGLQDYWRALKTMGDNSPAAQAAKGEAFANAKVFSGFNPAESQAAHAAGGRITPTLPGSEGLANPIAELAKGAAQTGKDLAGYAASPSQWANLWGKGGPLEQVGVGQGAKNFPLLEAGRKTGTQVEDVLRLAQYMGGVRKGLDPAEAGRRVLETHFDYSKLTPFERKVMRRAVPFYSYMRNNLPLQLENLTQRPGSIVPQLRATAVRPGQAVPEHLASGVAIPLGGEDERGNQQFLSQLGLPIEEAFERWHMKPEGLAASARDTAYAYMGALNPVIKGPLEWLFDTQLFSGRRLSDLRPQGAVGTLGSLLDPESRHRGLTQFASQALANSPATRFLTMADKLADPRKSIAQKALNTLTGVRVSDVDMEKTRAIEMRRVLESILRSNPAISQHTDLYVRPEDQASLTPEDMGNLQVLSLLQSNAQRAARRRRAEAPAG